MEQRITYITATEKEGIRAEILYAVGHAHTAGEELLLFVPREKEKQMPALHALLRTFKKQGKIRLFYDPDSTGKGGTAESYLLNKYPSLFENMHTAGDGRIFVCI